jgi:DNA-binding MurR/RpiR family transcriptional regulator
VLTETAPSVAERIRRDLGGLTPNERRAAQRLLADYPVAGLDTAARFGKAAGVSAPTVLRMIAKLGFPSYGAFQDALRAELAARRQTPLMKGGDITAGDRLRQFADAAIANIRQTEANVPRDEFAAIVRRLADGKRPVHVAGGRFTAAIAEYLVLHLRVLRPGVRVIGGERQGRVDQLLDIAKGDTLVVFDIRRYSDDLAELTREAVRRGAAVTLFTDQWLSPISKIARHVLPAHVVAPSVWDSSAGLLLLVEAVLSAVAGDLGDRARQRLVAIEALRED